ncbi:MAG: hypothetical protein K5979_02980, partial [Ruminococcus sp.]|nr:hypothetical protein [Ruminococcus sp.]
AAFCKWAQPDNFIARNYEMLSIKDIQHYIKVKNRSFASFCLPIIAVIAAIIWVVSLLVFSKTMVVGIIIAAVLTVAVAVAVLVFYKKQKKKERVRLYKKISSNWGIVIK